MPAIALQAREATREGTSYEMADNTPPEFSSSDEVSDSAPQDRPEELLIPKIVFNGLERLDSQDSTSPAQSYGACSSVAPTPSLSATSIQDEDLYVSESSLDISDEIFQLDREGDFAEYESDHEIHFGSSWRDGRLYIHGADQPVELITPFAGSQPSILAGLPVLNAHERPPALEDVLCETLEYPDHPERKRFFPKTTFTAVVNQQAVREELRKCYRTLDPSVTEGLAQTICGELSFRKIFALLALVGKVADIQRFIEEGVHDDDLPLRKISQPSSPIFRLGRAVDQSADEPEPLKCFDGWNTTVIWMFEDWQWATLAPTFHGGERKNINHVSLEGRVPLPFLNDSRYGVRPRTIRGGFSTVFKVDIHPDHHTFRNHRIGDSTSFAVKCLSTKDESLFDREVDMLRSFSDDAHPHLISLLATYRQLDKFYLIFPWADADLYSYWKDVNPHPTMNHETVLWVSEQCLGIATGLLSIHRHDTMRVASVHGSGVDDVTDQQIQLFGRHGDIKSNNILWFRNKDTYPGHRGVLKITDFGLAEFQRAESTIYKSPSRTAVSAAYRSPECDIKGGRIGPSHDIWALGCLFLEFIAWALGGWDLVNKFQEAREVRDRDEYYGISMDAKFFKITIGSEGEAVAKVKNSVTSFIGDLRRHQYCTPYLGQFLDLIQTQMLIIKPNDPEDLPRIRIGALTGQLKELCRACKNVEFAVVQAH